MTPEAADRLRRAAAHVLVDAIGVPALDDAAAHHVFRVLRVRDGEVVTATDGAGGWRACRATGGAIEPIDDVAIEPPPVDPLTIAFAIPKQDRPEWIVQKLTELGVARIVLLHAERSIVRWDADRAERHRAKLQRVAVEALQQSRGVRLPEIAGPLPAADVLGRSVVAEPGGRPLASRDRSIAIGPEGGWADAELALAADRVSLGASVLRVETAALVAASRALEHSP